MPISEHRECEVCHRVRDVMVFSSPFVAMSFANCNECLHKPAEPELVFKYLLEEVADGDPSKLDRCIQTWYTWMDGKYVHWNTYVHIMRQRKDNVDS
jgi:hypothetical protein